MEKIYFFIFKNFLLPVNIFAVYKIEEEKKITRSAGKQPDVNVYFESCTDSAVVSFVIFY